MCLLLLLLDLSEPLLFFFVSHSMLESNPFVNLNHKLLVDTLPTPHGLDFLDSLSDRFDNLINSVSEPLPVHDRPQEPLDLTPVD